MSVHSPSPWTTDDHTHIYSKTGGVVAFLGHDRNDRPPQFREGDARLIAAAPEMLEALKLLTECVLNEAERNPSAPIFGSATERALRAIAKAEG